LGFLDVREVNKEADDVNLVLLKGRKTQEEESSVLKIGIQLRPMSVS
jgi:hypothetical protein